MIKLKELSGARRLTASELGDVQGSRGRDLGAILGSQAFKEWGGMKAAKALVTAAGFKLGHALGAAAQLDGDLPSFP